MSARLTPDTLANIRKNAGKVAPVKIAESLGWSLPQLERVARDKRIDLHLRVFSSSVARSEHEPLTAHAAEHPTHRHYGPARIGRSEPVQIRLFPADANAIDAVAHACGLRRAQAIARLIENARDRGLIEDLVRLPAPKPTKEEGESQ